MNKMVGDDIFLDCPHCSGLVVIHESDINCKIFRHAIWKDEKKQTKTPFGPHTSKAICDQSFIDKTIYGCGKPFKLIRKTKKDVPVLERCSYC